MYETLYIIKYVNGSDCYSLYNYEWFSLCLRPSRKEHVFPLTLFKKIWKFNVGNTFFFNYYLGNTVQKSD